MLDTNLVADLINREYQSGTDEVTLASLARRIAETIEDPYEQEGFLDYVTMSGLTL